MTSALSAKQLDATVLTNPVSEEYHEMIVTITHPAAGQDMKLFQHRPAIGLMDKHENPPGGFTEAALSALIYLFCSEIDCFSLPPLSSNLKVFSLEELRAALPACCLMPPSISVLFCLSRSSRGS